MILGAGAGARKKKFSEPPQNRMSPKPWLGLNTGRSQGTVPLSVCTGNHQDGWHCPFKCVYR